MRGLLFRRATTAAQGADCGGDGLDRQVCFSTERHGFFHSLFDNPCVNGLVGWPAAPVLRMPRATRRPVEVGNLTRIAPPPH